MPQASTAAPMPDNAQLSADLKATARTLGFDLAGIAPAVAAPGVARLDEWLSQGYAGQMHYLPDRRAAYDHPNSVLDGVRSIVMLAMNYRTAEPAPPAAGQGRVSRYAWGADYHKLIRRRLDRLADWLRERSPAASVRGVVDTAPLMERELAQLAGLGWIGKNTLLLNREMGSWFFLAALLTDLDLDCDAPHATDHCGTCRACLDACPTQAFAAPYVLDASRCISYLTIELRGQVPLELREGMGDWVFGCDVCQDVCPWNRRAPETSEPAFAPAAGRNPLELAELFFWSDADFAPPFCRQSGDAGETSRIAAQCRDCSGESARWFGFIPSVSDSDRAGPRAGRFGTFGPGSVGLGAGAVGHRQCPGGLVGTSGNRGRRGRARRDRGGARKSSTVATGAGFRRSTEGD